MRKNQKYFALLLIFLLNIRYVINKSIFGIGRRIQGDELLVKDIIYVRSSGFSYSLEANFNYIVVEPITYIDVFTEKNVFAKVNVRYQNDLVEGTLIGINSSVSSNGQLSTVIKPFDVLIRIYGFLQSHVDQRLVLSNRNRNYTGLLEPQKIDGNEYTEDHEYNPDFNSDEYLYSSDEKFEKFSSSTFEPSYELEWNELEHHFQSNDKIIEIGQRQKNDYLIYETFQTSPTSTELASSHSVIFYYIDSVHITYVKFIIFDHFSEKSTTSVNYIPPLAEYSLFSPHSLKAIITDYFTTSLFVQMKLYGYEPQDLPDNYVPFLKGSLLTDKKLNIDDTKSTISPLQQLKNLFNVEPNKQILQTGTQVDDIYENNTIHNSIANSEFINRVEDFKNNLSCGQISLLPTGSLKYLFLLSLFLSFE